MHKETAICLLLCLTGVLTAPYPQDKEPVPILSYENNASVEGTFHYSFEGGDGTKVEQDGQLKDVTDEEGKPAKAEEIRGSYSYVGDDGQTYVVTYIADENGYQPSGVHLPSPPPIPEAIQRSLDFLATAPPPKE